MDAERWAIVTAHFDELVELSGARRAERLADIGRADPRLRQQVEALLNADVDRLESEFAWIGDPLGLMGRTVSHFTVERPLGAGGMGVVYRAVDVRLDRVVALKLPHASLRSDPSWKARFLREARAAAALDHPNLCQIFDVGETADGQPFLAMPLYPGETLQARLARESTLPLDLAIAIARQLAAGLGAMHGAGMVHRDLKPGNVMLLPDGEVKILDFGLAKTRHADLTDPGIRPGTVAYMAPEQILERQVDHRADYWALGVVLYEMLTGRKPFAGDHDVSVAHAIVHAAPPAPASLRGDLPAWASELVLGLLDKDAERREGAMRALVNGERSIRRRPHRRAPLVAGALALLALLGWTLLRRSAPPRALDANLLAVAPFDVVDADLRVWSEGMVDLLSRTLDRSGPLRAVSQSVSVNRWRGRADPASAEELGRLTGAELVVFGSLVRIGSDSVRLRASVLDRSRGTTGPDIEVLGEERRMGELADSLGVRVLRVLGRDRPIGSVRHVSIGSRSLPALKEFLAGEQYYRRAQWDSALVHYDRAIAEDSTFGLALRRMAYALGWGAAGSGSYRTPEEYLERAVAQNRGLAPRDSLLFLAESLAMAGASITDPSAWLRNRFLVAATTEETARRYPDDPEIWYDLGETLTHWPAPVGADPRRALHAFERAIALDPGFGPAYEHTVDLAMRLGMPERARRHARAYAALGPADASAPGLRLVALILDSGGMTAPAVQRAVRTASANTLVKAGNDDLKWWTDSAATSVLLLRDLARGGHDVRGVPPSISDPRTWGRRLATALAVRGRMNEAVAAYGDLLTDPAEPPPFYERDDPFRDFALLGIIPDSIATAVFAESLGPEARWDGRELPRYLRGLPWWAARGDTIAITRFQRHAAEVARTSDRPRAVLRARYLGAAAGAYAALVRRDSARALRAFEAIPDSLCLVGFCSFEKLTLAQLVAARGEEARAAELLDRWMWTEGSTAGFMLAALERARVAERLSDRDRAATLYHYITEMWRDADPGLRPYVDEARAGLDRLRRGEPR